MWIDDIEIVMLFIPLVVTTAAVLRRYAPGYVTIFLLLASLGFYALADWQSAWVLALLMFINLATIAACERFDDKAKIIVSISILLHFIPLALWKYMGFESMPLGLSFVTFLLISALIDIRAGAPRLGTVPQSLHALFFASVSAGPITRYRDLAPQLRELGCRPVASSEILRGASMAIFGLAKICVVGRPIQDAVQGILAATHAGIAPTIIEAWYVVVGGLVALYFLFSGYSDIALGVGMMVGLALSPNFDSPFKAKSGPDLIDRWHKSLMDWIRAYLFLPIIRYVLSLNFASMTTMSFVAWSIAVVLSVVAVGAWHGGSWPPILAGFTIGTTLVLVRVIGAFGFQATRFRVPLFIHRLLLLCIVSLVSVPILNHDPDSLGLIFAHLFDFDSFSIGQKLSGLLSEIFPLSASLHAQFSLTPMPNARLGGQISVGFLVCAVFVAFLSPNTLQIFGQPNRSGETKFTWNPTILWGAVLAILLIVTMFVSNFTTSTGFIYDNF